MGQNKLLLPWGKKTILEHCLQTFLCSRVNEIILVVNDQTEKIARQLKERRVKVIVNPDYRRGMSSSIRLGLKLLNPKSKGVFIGLGDQPLLRSRTVNALIDAFEKGEGKVIVPSFQGRMGHPVLFDRRYKGELLKLKGDEGGRSILKRHVQEVLMVPVRSAGVIRDIDRWRDYKRLLRK